MIYIMLAGALRFLPFDGRAFDGITPCGPRSANAAAGADGRLSQAERITSGEF